ncbi:MAG: HlyD family efflux transporter periplasmic adaptor subunit [Alphaproteobacteria bacterium]|nr:HlyD family efflux transporter periplasmic adaptor subunit [Alphaproteobacteria bacterium]
MNHQAPQNQTQDRLAVLLGLQRDARGAGGLTGFGFIAVNRVQRLLPCSMASLWIAGPLGVQVISVSGVPTPDADAPFVQWLKALVASAKTLENVKKISVLTAGMVSGLAAEDWPEWSPPYLLWVPFLHPGTGDLIGGLVLARSDPWPQGEMVLAESLASGFAETLLRFLPREHRLFPKLKTKRARLWALGLSVAVLLFPVRQSVVAQAEIAPRDPIVLAAPREGVVAAFHVAPNQAVAENDPVFSLDDTELKARHEVALKELAVAEAEHQKASFSAFESPQAKAELGVLESRIAKARAEAEFAGSLLERGLVRAPKAGIAVYSDPNDWIGKPVRTGERIATLADSSKAEIQAWVPVADAIVLEPGADVRMYLNTAPLSPLSATTTSSAYEATLTPERILAYRVRAVLDAGEDVPRVGLKGTAKLYGSRVPLIYYLLRRPLAVARQWSGL